MHWQEATVASHTIAFLFFFWRGGRVQNFFKHMLVQICGTVSKTQVMQRSTILHSTGHRFKIFGIGHLFLQKRFNSSLMESVEIVIPLLLLFFCHKSIISLKGKLVWSYFGSRCANLFF